MNRQQVLIIDDDRDVAGFFATVLRFAGMECEVVITAREALLRLAGTAPDLILLDMRLGSDIGGEEILYQIRSNTRFDNTRVIVITAYPSTTETVSNMADLVLIKPVEIDLLRALVERLDADEPNKNHCPSFRDPVSGLFNREFFHTRLELAFERQKRRREFVFGVAVYQLVPDVLPVPPEVEVHVLTEAAGRLHTCIRPTDTVARLAEWRFATLNEEMRSSDDIQVIIERVEAALALPYLVKEKEYRFKIISSSALTEEQFFTPTRLLFEAENRLEKKVVP